MQYITRLSDENLSYLLSQSNECKKAMKGYDGKAALVAMTGDVSMLVPDVNGLPEFVDFAWSFVLFGNTGRTPDEKIVCKEIEKFLNGKPYSMKKMADASSGIRKH